MLEGFIFLEKLKKVRWNIHTEVLVISIENVQYINTLALKYYETPPIEFQQYYDKKAVQSLGPTFLKASKDLYDVR